MKEKVCSFDMPVSFQKFTINFPEVNDSVDIFFNPTDEALPSRLFEAQKKIEERSKALGDFKIDENGLPEADEYIEKSNELRQIIYDEIDYAFGNKISDKLFKYCSPLTVTNGKYYFLQFIEKITPILKEIIEEENKKASAYANKHLAKYMKK